MMLLGERLASIWQESSECKEWKTQEISQPKVLFSRTSKQEERRFCPALYHSEHNNPKAVWALLLCMTFKEAAYMIGCGRYHVL